MDDDASAIGAHRPVDLGVLGDVAQTARAVLAALARPGRARVPVRRAAGADRRARSAGATCPTTDEGRAGPDGVIDPRTLTIALDDLLPAERMVAIDSGNFMGYPSMFLSVPDEHGFCFTQAYQSVGLGLASAIGAALAQPDRLPVAALGDGGALMGISELETVVRLGLPMVDRGLRRRGVRGRGAPFRAGRVRAGHGQVPARRHRRHRPRFRLRRGDRPRPGRPRRRCATGWPGRGTGRWSSTPRWPRPAAPGGWKRPSAATDPGRSGWPGRPTVSPLTCAGTGTPPAGRRPPAGPPTRDHGQLGMLHRPGLHRGGGVGVAEQLPARRRPARSSGSSSRPPAASRACPGWDERVGDEGQRQEQMNRLLRRLGAAQHHAQAGAGPGEGVPEQQRQAERPRRSASRGVDPPADGQADPDDHARR